METASSIVADFISHAFSTASEALFKRDVSITKVLEATWNLMVESLIGQLALCSVENLEQFDHEPH